jgi:hypothetical protein
LRVPARAQYRQLTTRDVSTLHISTASVCAAGRDVSNAQKIYGWQKVETETTAALVYDVQSAPLRLPDWASPHEQTVLLDNAPLPVLLPVRGWMSPDRLTDWGARSDTVVLE